MPMRYADEDDVLAQLRLDPDAQDDDDAVDRVRRLELGLCEAFDEKIGCSFGVEADDEERIIVVGRLEDYDYFAWGHPFVTAYPNVSPRLILDTPIRSVTAIEIGGTWDGTAWVDGTAVAIDGYRLTNLTGVLFYGIDLLYGYWSGVVRITGIWGDQPVEDVPVDVREAMTFITVDEYRMRNASPAGEIGPDGMVIPTRNPWRFEFVKTVIERHALVRIMV